MARAFGYSGRCLVLIAYPRAIHSVLSYRLNCFYEGPCRNRATGGAQGCVVKPVPPHLSRPQA
jgi:hypothetical protein